MPEQLLDSQQRVQLTRGEYQPALLYRGDVGQRGEQDVQLTDPPLQRLPHLDRCDQRFVVRPGYAWGTKQGQRFGGDSIRAGDQPTEVEERSAGLPAATPWPTTFT